VSVKSDPRWRGKLDDADGNGLTIGGITEIADSLGGARPAALYQLTDGRYCLFVYHPARPDIFGPGAQSGSTHVICATRVDAEKAATAMGVGERLGIEVASAEKL